MFHQCLRVALRSSEDRVSRRWSEHTVGHDQDHEQGVAQVEDALPEQGPPSDDVADDTASNATHESDEQEVDAEAERWFGEWLVHRELPELPWPSLSPLLADNSARCASSSL